jgi:hypothetical protein
MVKRINNTRRECGLRVEERIDLDLAGAEAFLAVARRETERLSTMTLATSISFGRQEAALTGWSEVRWEVEGEELVVRLRRAGP